MNNTDDAQSGEAATDAFLDLWALKEDAELSSAEDETTHDEDDAEETEDATLSDDAEAEDEVTNDSEDDEPVDEDDEKPKRKDFSDDDIISVKIDGEETEVSLRDLKRQYGQHRANDLRSKEIARERKALDDTSQTTRIAAETLYNRVAEKAKQWEGIDWVSALKTLDADSFNALRAERDKDHADLEFYRDGLSHEVQRYQQRQAQDVQTRMVNVVAEISNPDTGIKGFNEDYGNKLATYALEMGVPQDRLTDLVHTPIMRILHDAYRYRQSETAKANTTPVKKTPTKIVKQSSNSETSRRAAAPKNTSALERLKRSGSRDDATDAFLAMWKDD